MKLTNADGPHASHPLQVDVRPQRSLATDLQSDIVLDRLGEAILNDIEQSLRKYCVLPSSHHYTAVALWIMATHALPAFDIAPRLVVRSAEMRSGKTRLMEIVTAMAFKGLLTSNVSDAVLYRTVENEHPQTILVDEADVLFGYKATNSREGLRGIIDAGFQRGTVIPRMTGPHSVTAHNFEPFAMVALAGIGEMPGTIEDRAVVVQMRRRTDAESISPYRSSRHREPLVAISEAASAWAKQSMDVLAQADPDIPVDDRAADVWYPLIAIADAIGGRWPDAAREACEVLVEIHQGDGVSRSVDLQLLRDTREVWRMTGSTFLASADLCGALKALPDSRWADVELSPSKLGRRLKKFGIATAHSTDRAKRGYRPSLFDDAFARYLPASID